MGNRQGFRHVRACRDMILLASQKCVGVASVAGMLERKDIGSLGRTDMGDQEVVVLPSLLMTSWSAWSSACGWMRSQSKASRSE